MNITEEQLINFVFNNGDEYGVTIEDVELVGINKCVAGASCCNAAFERGATEQSILSCYFSRNFKSHLSEAKALDAAEYIIYVTEYCGDCEPIGGRTVYCGSHKEAIHEAAELHRENDIDYRIYDKNGKLIQGKDLQERRPHGSFLRSQSPRFGGAIYLRKD